MLRPDLYLAQMHWIHLKPQKFTLQMLLQCIIVVQGNVDLCGDVTVFSWMTMCGVSLPQELMRTSTQVSSQITQAWLDVPCEKTRMMGLTGSGWLVGV